MDRAQGIELQRRALSAFVRMLGRSSEDAAVLEGGGVVASIVPSIPDRSVVNSVVYGDAESLRAALDELGRAYEAAGVRAWTVWVPEEDRSASAILRDAGHVLDAAPMAMVLDDLTGLPDPEPDGLEWDDRADPADVGRINDLAYGYEVGTFGAGLARVPADARLRLYQARVDGDPASVVGTIDDQGDCGVYLVATLDEHRGRGLARRLLHLALAEARQRGCRTSTLQATRAGYSVYERLGYEPICALQMWERRKA